MKAQFKYAFRAGLSPRMYAFAIILVMNLAFIVPGLLGVLPVAAMITGVSLGGTAIAVMIAFNIAGDISITRTIFTPPGAVFYALTPAPRRDRLIASVLTMIVMDFVTTAIAITGVIVLALNLGSHYSGMSLMEMLRYDTIYFGDIGLLIAGVLVAYLLITSVVFFCRAMRKSVFFSKRAGGLLTFLTAAGVVYGISVAPLLLAPFGTVTGYGLFFTVTLGQTGMYMYSLLLLIIAAVLFVLTARLIERKINL